MLIKQTSCLAELFNNNCTVNTPKIGALSLEKLFISLLMQIVRFPGLLFFNQNVVEIKRQVGLKSFSLLLILSVAFGSLRAEGQESKLPEFVRLEYFGVSIEVPANWLVTYPDIKPVQKGRLAKELINSKVVSVFPGIVSTYKKSMPMLTASQKTDENNVILLFGPQNWTQSALAKMTDKDLKRAAFFFTDNIRKKVPITLHGKAVMEVARVNSSNDLALKITYTFSKKEQTSLSLNQQMYILPVKDYQIELSFLYNTDDQNKMQPVFEHIWRSLRY